MTTEQRLDTIKELAAGLHDQDLLALQMWVSSEQWRRHSCVNVPFSYQPSGNEPLRGEFYATPIREIVWTKLKGDSK